MKVLFLDIDGVLNGHQTFGKEHPYCKIDRRCVAQLNRVIDATDCRLVISSAWRYQMIAGECTRVGFGYLLATHGVRILGLSPKELVVGYTLPDEVTCHRADQIHAWLKSEKERVLADDYPPFAIVDDMAMRLPWFMARRFVRVKGPRGLTRADADKLIQILGRENR